MFIYDDTFIDAYLLVGIVLVVGTVAYFMDRANYRATYGPYWHEFFPWFQQIASWGFMACSLLVLTNYYFASTEEATSVYKIENVTNVTDSRDAKNERRKYKIGVNYKGKSKDLVYWSKSSSNPEKYKAMRLKTRRGLWGYDIIVEKDLKKWASA